MVPEVDAICFLPRAQPGWCVCVCVCVCVFGGERGGGEGQGRGRPVEEEWTHEEDSKQAGERRSDVYNTSRSRASSADVASHKSTFFSSSMMPSNSGTTKPFIVLMRR